MLLKAREKQKTYGLDDLDLLLSDVESLPFPDQAFDIVSCRFAFHHFPNPEKALREMKRVCRGKHGACGWCVIGGTWKKSLP